MRPVRLATGQELRSGDSYCDPADAPGTERNRALREQQVWVHEAQLTGNLACVAHEPEAQLASAFALAKVTRLLAPNTSRRHFSTVLLGLGVLCPA